jgi:hypothetical protein
MIRSRLPRNGALQAVETIRRQGDSLLLLTALSIYPPLFLYVHNIARFPFTVVLEPATVIAVFTLSFWALLSIVSGHPKKTAFILSVNLLLFFSYGAFTTYLLRVHFHIHGCTFGYKSFL